MAGITLKGNKVKTIGNIPAIGAKAPDFKLVNKDLAEVSLGDYVGKRKILNIFPSLDTPVCARSVRSFNKEAASLKDTVVLNISADLPFAHKRFCAVEAIENAEALSTFRSSFARDYNVEIVDSPLAGLCSRVVIVLDKSNEVIYSEQVQEIANEPKYAEAIEVLKD